MPNERQQFEQGTQHTPRRRHHASGDDFSGAARGVTARRYAEGANVVVVAPDLLDVFPDAEAVNEVLRALAPILRRANSA